MLSGECGADYYNVICLRDLLILFCTRRPLAVIVLMVLHLVEKQARAVGDPMFDIAAPSKFFRPRDLVTFRHEPVGQNCEGIQLSFITKDSSRTIPPFQATA